MVTGNGKFEELVVCSQEIAASTTQLVVASKVKADRGSKNLNALSSASKDVTEATGNVVATAKSGAQRIEDSGMLKIRNLFGKREICLHCLSLTFTNVCFSFRYHGFLKVIVAPGQETRNGSTG